MLPSASRSLVLLPHPHPTPTPPGGARAPSSRFVSPGGALRLRCGRRGSAVAMAFDGRVERIASTIRVIPDFPKPGILFQDITTLLLDPQAFQDTTDLFVERYKDKSITVVAGEVISEEYSLEYGTDKIEMHVGAVQPGDRVLIVDDLIATGGTLCAAAKLIERVGAEVVECACVIELPELKGRDKLGNRPVFVLVKAEESC
ncbi:unnamed protein product [Alopecurus aequalis]